jgi:hypothetical protein
MLPIAVVLSVAAANPAPATVTDPLLEPQGGVCVATGYCTLPGRGSVPPGGVMYLAIGVVGTGVTMLRMRKATDTKHG